MTPTRSLASVLALAASLAWAAPLQAQIDPGNKSLVINGETYAVQGDLPPPGAEKAVVINNGKRFEIFRDGNEWVTADGKPPGPGSTKGIILQLPGATKYGPAPHLGNAPGGPAGNLAAKGIVVVDGKQYQVQGAPPPPGAEKAVVIIGGKQYEIIKTGPNEWKSADGTLPDPGSTKGIIINWFPTETIKKAPGGPAGDLAAKGIVIHGKQYQVQGAPPPPGASKAIIVIGGKQYEIIKTGPNEWKSADGTLPDPGSTKGIVINWRPTESLKNAPGGPAGDLAAKGIVIHGKQYQVQGSLPAPGASKAVVVIGGKPYEIVKVGPNQWKTADGNLPDPGTTKGIILQTPPGGAKALDDMPGAPTGKNPPDGGKALRGMQSPPEPDKTTSPALGGPDTRRGLTQPPEPDKSRRGGTR